jgi:hypothetical protein
LDRIAAGEPVAPSQYYFRTAPRFYPPDGKYEWLKKSIFLGDAERHPELVILRVWRVAWLVQLLGSRKQLDTANKKETHLRAN